MVENVIIARCLNKPGKEGGLSEVKVFRGTPEICLRRRLNPVSMIAEIVFIEVNLEDLILRVLAGDFHRQQHFANFAQKTAFGSFLRREQQSAGELLRDGRCAGHRLPCLGVLKYRTNDRG